MSKDDLGKYSNGPGAVARFVAQQLVMKPYVWSALSVHVHGMRRLDGLSAPFIAIANHSSHLDTTVIYGALPRRLSRNLAAGAAADYFFKQKTKSVGTRLFFNAYPVDRGGMKGHAGLSGRLLDEDVPLLIFPEGTRSRTGAMAPFKPGAAALCISRHVPVVPIALVGAYAAWPYKQPNPPLNRPTVHVVIGRPMMPRPGEIAHEFNERVRRQVLELHDSTARAYGMKTLAEYAHTAALEKAQSEPQQDPKEKQ